MNKQTFISELKHALTEEHIAVKNREEIVEDYEQMIDEALLNDENIETIIKRLGNPKDIARSLRKSEPTEAYKNSNHNSTKFVALSPFIATIIFMILGLQFNLWHPGWLIFLMIPIAGVLSSTDLNFTTLLTALSPFIATAVYLLLGFLTNNWHPYWIIFFIIPMFGVLNSSNKKKRIIGFLFYLLFPLLYFYLEVINFSRYNWIVFIIMTVVGLMFGFVEINIHYDDPKKVRQIKAFLITLTIIYLVLGFGLTLWHPGWIIFLLIPVYFMKTESNKSIPLVAYTPFISVALFILIGEFWAYKLAWLVFFIIPISGVFEGFKN